MKVFRHYTQAELELQYDSSARSPDLTARRDERSRCCASVGEASGSGVELFDGGESGESTAGNFHHHYPSQCVRLVEGKYRC